MGLLDLLPFRKTKPKPRARHDAQRVIVGRYDAAATSADNARHWANADGLSADDAANPQVRRTLRNRSRYEVANNAYAKGLVLTLANDCVGTGPRLQLLTADDEINRLAEQAFADWARAVSLAEKLRTMRMAKAADGETFAVLTHNPGLASPVMLDIQLVEADRVTSPTLRTFAGNAADGIEFDAWGNPVFYYVLRRHPGATGTLIAEFDRVAAESVIHWFRTDRPGQHRGIPEITPSLPLFAQLRRYTQAVLSAAETAADFAAVLFTDSPANGEAAAVEPMDVVDLEKRMATVLPDGWKLGQVEAQQPTTTYGEFKREILAEIGRCQQVPVSVVTGDSSRHNYASGRLDHQVYFKGLRIEQSHLSTTVLDRVLAAWVAEARLLPGFRFLRGLATLPHQWFWDGNEHVDPAKEANAQATRLASYTTTLASEYARQGLDWEAELRQRAREKKLMDELGLAAPPAAPAEPDKDEEKESDDADGGEGRQAA